MPRAKIKRAPTLAIAPPKAAWEERWAVLIILVATLPWWIALVCPFIRMDDDLYVSSNHYVLNGLMPANMAWAFTTGRGGFWFPLTWLSLMLDATVFGTGTAGFHATNVLLHIANTILVYLFFKKATGSPGRSLLVALLFSLHPLRVESVAWVTERKDVLFTFFGLLALLAYLRYVRGGGRKAYLLMLVAYACSLMCKSMLVTMPAVLFLLDFWPLERFGKVPIRRLIVEKIPVIALAAGGVLATLLVQQHTNNLVNTAVDPLGLRLQNMLVSYVLYLRDGFYFGGLSVFYPLPQAVSAVDAGLSAALLIAVTALAIVAARGGRPGRVFLVGWLWFLITLLPVIGLIQSGLQARADRFTYFPAIGWTASLVFLWPSTSWLRQHPAQIRLASAGLVIVLSVYMTMQLWLWRDPLQLYMDGIAHGGESGMLEYVIGCQLQADGNDEEALKRFLLAAKLSPESPEVNNNASVLLTKKGHYQEALVYLDAALRARPNDKLLQSNKRVLEAYVHPAAPAVTKP